jgi:hypothetical protein
MHRRRRGRAAIHVELQSYPVGVFERDELHSLARVTYRRSFDVQCVQAFDPTVQLFLVSARKAT